MRPHRYDAPIWSTPLVYLPTNFFQRSLFSLLGRCWALRLCGKWQKLQELPLSHPTALKRNKHALHSPVACRDEPTDCSASSASTSMLPTGSACTDGDSANHGDG